MIILYTVLLTFLRAVAFVLRRRARALERKYLHIARAADKLAQQPVHRPGNANRPDPYKSARQQFELGRLVHLRDRVEARHFAWQLRHEKFSKRVKALQQWKGRRLPYLLGALDLALVLLAVDHFGLGTVDLTPLDQTLRALLTR